MKHNPLSLSMNLTDQNLWKTNLCDLNLNKSFNFLKHQKFLNENWESTVIHIL